ncbi:MAG: hypothetical protein E7324_04435, partial [Clostridiales bacterium]|nr:hypothetical protein [Clostridiales bacterium]
MIFKRCLLLMMIFVMLPFSVPAQGAVKLEIEANESGFTYAYSVPGEDFTVLWYSTPAESGRLVLYAADGQYAGEVALPLSQAGGRLKVWAEDLNQKKLAEVKLDLFAAADYQAPAGDSHAKVKDFALTETLRGFEYSFSAPECDY